MSTILCFSVNMGCCVYINEEKNELNQYYGSKFWGQDILKWINICNHQGCIKLIKSDSKDFYNLKKYIFFK